MTLRKFLIKILNNQMKKCHLMPKLLRIVNKGQSSFVNKINVSWLPSSGAVKLFFKNSKRKIELLIRRIFFCQFCDLAHQVSGGVVIFAGTEELQHFLHNDSDILGVCDPKEQLQRLQAKTNRNPNNAVFPKNIGWIKLNRTTAPVSPHAWWWGLGDPDTRWWSSDAAGPV